MVKPIFIVFEGIDGSGKTSQIVRLADEIRARDKYQPILLTREPTWRASEIKKRLTEDKDAFSDGDNMAYLYVQDRKEHCADEIEPMLRQNVAVLCDRYSMSTLAYQSAQGVELDKLLDLHEAAEITTPSATFYVRVSQQVALDRMQRRGGKMEKFEQDPKFVEKLIKAYDDIAGKSKGDRRIQAVTGKIEVIDGNHIIGDVAVRMRNRFMSVCDYWLEGRSR